MCVFFLGWSFCFFLLSVSVDVVVVDIVFSFQFVSDLMLNWKHLNDILFFTSVQLHYTMWMSDRWQKLCCFCCVCIFQENVSYISTAIVNAYSNFVFSRHTYYKVHCISINLFTNIVACKSTYIYMSRRRHLFGSISTSTKERKKKRKKIKFDREKGEKIIIYP